MTITWQIIIGVIIQIGTAAFVYGRLTERVKTLSDRSIDHGRRISNLEAVTSGTGGHGERLTAIEAIRLENLRRGSGL